MRNFSRRKAGFTLIELLVVISIIAILMSLLLPAVQQAREAARRTQCQNNLKQLGLALHNYHDSYRVFPPGWVDQNSSGAANWGWHVYVFPMMDQGNLYDRIDVGNGSLGYALDDAVKQQAMSQPVPGFRCPSDIAPDINMDQLMISESTNQYALSTTNYVGANGGGDWSYPDTGLDGMFGRNSRVRIRDFTDGTTNTVVVGERAWEKQDGPGSKRRCKAAVLYGVNLDTISGFHAQRTALAKGLWGINEVRGDDLPGLGRCEVSFSSMHPGGGIFLLGDGSCRFISENIQRNQSGAHGDFLWQNLLNKSDGNVVSEF